MMNRRTILEAVAFATVLALVASAAPQAAERDHTFRAAAVDRVPVTRVALLPVVSVVENENAERAVEATWLELYGGGPACWLGANEVRARLDAAGLETAGAAVWRSGELEPADAARLVEALGVDAVMCVRIDRWEVVDGGRAIVEMTAVMQGPDGAPLWGITGGAGCGMPRGSRERNFDADMTWLRTARLEPSMLADAKLGGALCNLLVRWGGELPEAPQYAARHEGSAPGGTTILVN